MRLKPDDQEAIIRRSSGEDYAQWFGSGEIKA
jgi:hypothetical protein